MILVSNFPLSDVTRARNKLDLSRQLQTFLFTLHHQHRYFEGDKY